MPGLSVADEHLNHNVTPMKTFRDHATLIALLFAFASAISAAADHHLRSLPENMVSGYFSADTPPVPASAAT